MPFMGMTFAGSLAIAQTLVQASLKKGRRFLKKLTQLLVCSLVGLLLFGCVNRSQPVRVIPLPEVSTPTADIKKLTSGRSGTVSEVAPPAIFQDLTDLFTRSTNAQQPQVTITQPTSDQVIETTSVSLEIKLKGLTIYKDKKLGLGPHLQVVLDNQPAQSIYDLEDPLKFSDLAPGSHTLRVFAVKPWGESFKGDTAYAQTTFHVFAKTGENTPQRDLPLLTYNEPQGDFGAEPILLDFHLNNAPLHRIAENDPDVSDWRIRCDLNGQSFIFDRWQPIYLKGFKPGQNWVQLTLIDEQGKPIDNAFNSTVRIINYEPAKRNTLAKMVRGELSLRQVGQIMVPGYEPPVEPIIEAPIIEEPVIDEPVVETPAIEAPAIDKPSINEPIIEAPSAEQQNQSSNSTASESPAKEKDTSDIEQPDEKRPASSQPIDDDLKNFDSFAKDKQPKEKPLDRPSKDQPSKDQPSKDQPSKDQPSKDQPEEKPEEQPEQNLLEPKATVEETKPQPNVELAPSESEFSAPETGDLETQNRQPQTDNPPANALDSPEPTNKTPRQPEESAVDALKQQDEAATGPDIADKIQTFWQQLKQKGTDALTKLKSPTPQDKPETPALPITVPDQLGLESETSATKEATTTEESTTAPSQDSDIETFNVEQPDTEQRLGKEADTEPADVEKGATSPLEQGTQQTTEQTLKNNLSEDNLSEDNLSETKTPETKMPEDKMPEDKMPETKTPEESIERALEEAIEQTIEKFDFEESPTELGK